MKPSNSIRTIFLFICLLPLVLSSGCVEGPAPVPSDPLVEEFEQPDDGQPLRIGSFYIRDPGTRKAFDPDVADVLANVIRNYDIIAIQGIGDGSSSYIPALVGTVNSDGSLYFYTLSENVGSNADMEHYAYIYNRERVELTAIPYVLHEDYGYGLLRRPYIASFRSLKGNLDCILISFSIDPYDASAEIAVLDDIVRAVQQFHPSEQDIILMGNMNADSPFIEEEASSSLDEGYFWAIDDDADTLVSGSSKAYDRIIMTQYSFYDFSGDSGVFRFDEEYGLSEEEALRLSEHYPVYADLWYDMDHDPGLDTYAYGQKLDKAPSSSEMTIHIGGLTLKDLDQEEVSQDPLFVVTGWEVSKDNGGYTYRSPFFNISSEGTLVLYTDSCTFELVPSPEGDGRVLAKLVED